MIQLQNLLNNPKSTEIIEITAVIDTALCVGAGGSSGSLADKPIVRTVEGKFLIPGSQVKGRWRHECEKLARGLNLPICNSPSAEYMCPKFSSHNSIFQRDDYQLAGKHHCSICQIFGNPRLASRVVFDDLICHEGTENLPEYLRPGVTINRRRGTAEDSKLYFLETSPAASLKFAGSIHLLPDCPSYAKPLLLAALQHIHALGGSKTGGLGWLQWNCSLQVTNEDWQELEKKIYGKD